MRLTRPLAYLSAFAALTGLVALVSFGIEDLQRHLADARHARAYEAQKAKELAEELDREKYLQLVWESERQYGASVLRFCNRIYEERPTPLPAGIAQQTPTDEHPILSAFYSCADEVQREYLAFVLLGEGENPFALRPLSAIEVSSSRRNWDWCGWDLNQREAAIEYWLQHHADAGAVFAKLALAQTSNARKFVPERPLVRYSVYH